MAWRELESQRVYAKGNKSEKDNYMISLMCGIQETKQRSKGKEREGEANQETDPSLQRTH